eukprot:CAMPEP_0185727390 /NCGR_PEP_ID=MMETSP1171-20130828/3087_1 /TAXON_ID=374046 /ORGANISM="Helicotheca tamensis, Strain CCMP826" /LENGTH=286 /DNA_ID=CAMNT_0028395947 /DNA_START=73 /DNA_END=933 /DNA_ORIENTATION=-
MSLASSLTKGWQSQRQFSLLTWNVWFGKLRQKERYSSLLSEVLSRDVDVACFQEVTTPFIEAVSCSNDIVDKYDVSPNRIRQYGCLILVKKHLRAQFEEIELPTRMDRSLILVRMENLVVGTVHLESLDSEMFRRLQLAMAHKVMHGDNNAILCGDFNFDSTRTWGDWRRKSPARTPEKLENNNLQKELPDWIDAWPAMKGGPDGGNPGLTFDGATNPVCVRDKREQMRYDRIMVKESTSLMLESISLTGTEPMDETNIKPSDHYGIHLVFQPKAAGQISVQENSA